MRFVDTNILLYAISSATEERDKQQQALQLLDSDDLALSVQVLQEFYVQSTRPSKPERISHDQATDLIESWLRFQVQEITIPILQAALSTKRRWGISYWDAAIVEAARATQCPILLSEDLRHGMDFAGVRVLNPFV